MRARALVAVTMILMMALFLMAYSGKDRGGHQDVALSEYHRPANAIQEDQTQGGIHSMPIDWHNPIMNGIVVNDLSQAAGHLPFEVSAPPGLGPAKRVLMTLPISAPLERHMVSLEYDTPEFGHFVAIEAVSETNVAELAAIAAQCLPETGCEGQMEMVQLGDGTTVALLIEGPTATSLTFLRGETRFDLIGDPTTFTRERALAVANKF